MVEGKNDFYALCYMNNVILDLNLNLNFLPGGGAGSLDDVIRLYVGWSRNFLVVLDSDREGEKQRERYIDLFGRIVEGRILTLRDLHPDLAGKSIEDAFDYSDRDTIQSIAYRGEAYAKSKFFRALQEALATRTVVSLSEPTKSRFSKVLEGLSSKLEEFK